MKYILSEIKGLWVAVPTFFTSNNELDIQAFIDHIKRIEQNIDGIVIAGTTGEGILLSITETNLLIQVAYNVTKKPIIFCLTILSRIGMIDILKNLDQTYIQGIMVLPGIYFSTTAENIVDMFDEVIALTKLPLLVYNNPARSGMDLTVEIMEMVFDKHHKQIIGIKECSGKAYRISELLQFFGRKQYLCSVMTGDDVLFIDSLKHGATGIISVAGNIVPLLMRQILHNYKSDLSQDFVDIWNSFVKSLKFFPNPQGVKIVACDLLNKQYFFRAFLSQYNHAQKKVLDNIVRDLRTQAWIA